MSLQNRHLPIAPMPVCPVSTSATCSGRGSVCLGSVSPICTCGCVRWASGTIFESCSPMADYETQQHDVLVIGSGGAGLRAAIEASAAGGSVGMVCKCLLGKAHTVMVEGGIAAALANVDERDSWKVHFSDTIRCSQYV